jgi:acetyltransferase-like isoleucine patch superfamily enzyme
LIVYILLGVILLVAVLAISFSIVGRNLGLFSAELLNRNLSSAVERWILYFVSGFTWCLARIRFPGTETVVTYSFDNKIGTILRAAYWKSRVKKLGKDVQIDVGAKATNWQLVSIGDNSWIDRNVILENGAIEKNKFMVFTKKDDSIVKPGELKIGKGCHISKNVVIQSCGGVFIGDYTGIASGAKIYSLSHHYKNMKSADEVLYKFTPLAPPGEQSLIEGPVVMEGNNALGLNSVILPGVTIGKNSWIGVCSCVVNDIPPNCVASGCPAKVIKIIRETQV